MRRNDECRAENFITGKKRYRKWIVTISILSIIVAVGTLYLLNKPATAVSEDGASSVGMVLGEGSSAATVEASANDGHGQDAVHVASVTEGTSEDGSSVSSTSASSASTASSASDAGVARSVSGVVLTGVFTDQNGKKIHEDTKLSVSDVLDLTAAPEKIEGYQYQKATINDKTVKSIRKITSSDDSATGSEAGASVSAAYMYVMEDDSEVKVTEDTEINFLYEAVSDARAVSVKATLVDEFGNEIDADRYSDIALPAFDRDGVLHLDDAENPPYEDVSVKTGLFKSVKYSFEKATVGESVITALKRTSVPNAQNTDTESVSADFVSSEASSASSMSSADSDTQNYAYFYTTDGKEWTALSEDTVVKMVYSSGKKTSYTYEDNSIKVTATLQKADAIPDDAELVVTPVTEGTKDYNYNAYMQALNDNADKIADSADIDSIIYNNENTLLYDISFVSNKEKVEPAEGSVAVSVRFKKNQLSDSLDVENADDLTIIHLPIMEGKDTISSASATTSASVKESAVSAEDISIDVLKETSVTVADSQEASFDLNSFSIISFVDSNSNIVKKIKPGTSYTYEDILGDAKYYGIVANTFAPSGHNDSNFAVKEIATSNGATAGAYTGNKNPGLWVIGKVDAGVSTFTLDRGTVWCTKDDSKKIQLNNGKIQIADANILTSYVDNLFGHINSISAKLANENSYTIDKEAIYKNQNDFNLDFDISTLGNGTFYVDGDAFFDLDGGVLANSSNYNLKIKKTSKQNIVFNISSKSVKLSTYSVQDIDGSTYNASIADSTSDLCARSIIFNMPNAENVVTEKGVCGILLAPKATFKMASGTSSGWLVVNKFSENNAEWHCVWQGMPTEDKIPTPAALTINASKQIDGQSATDAVTGKFSFTLKQYTGSKWISKETVKNTAGDVTFSGFSFSKDGTYYYRITEDTGNKLNGYKYDTSAYTVVVKVQHTTTTVVNTTTTTYYISSIKYYKYASASAIDTKNLAGGTETDNAVFNNTTSTSVTVTKNWDDNSDQYGTRWKNLGIALTASADNVAIKPVVDADGNEVQPYIMTAADASSQNTNQWTHTFSNLPVYDKNGKKISYSAREYWINENPWVELSNNENTYYGYKPGKTEVKVNNDNTTDITLTNSLTQMSVTVNKKWLDASGKDNSSGVSKTTLDLELWQKESKGSSWTEIGKVTVSSTNGWKATVNNLPAVSSSGDAYMYCIKEADADATGFSVTYTYNRKDYVLKDSTTTVVNSNGSSEKLPGYTINYGDKDTTVTITNRKPQDYILPSTGSVGTTPFRMIGILLIGIAAGSALYMKRKRPLR